MPKATQDIAAGAVTKHEVASRSWTCAGNRDTGGGLSAIAVSLRSRGAADHARPVNSVGLYWIRAHFHQARFNHHLLGWLVD